MKRTFVDIGLLCRKSQVSSLLSSKGWWTLQMMQFGSKKQKEKTGKDGKKLRNFLKISSRENEENEVMIGSNNEVSRRIENEINKVDYKMYDIKIEEIIKNYENKIKKTTDSCINIEHLHNISILKEKKNFKLLDLAQVVIKSSKLIYFYPYITSDIQKIIHSLKLKEKSWNPIISNDNQYIILEIPSLTNDVKLKKKKEAKDFLEKIKLDIRNMRYQIRDHIDKYIKGDEWKLSEKNKLDNYIKTKMKIIENVYNTYVKNW
ncbi:ribosome-recycling factor, putative [Plasmodium ovale]|uniref:Ribosome-recycling factor, putative n=2 Tax=Plasmodium ovale TaxID=36330 RepID=A0A1D3KY27_PLAOA|nr:ribosome-recycling factor, putative (RRF2) [Plasmodium ovale curtisi]SBS83403.1 ribosome-recycling factor, putative (RRF2) [Plasmodium ovale curtisi]SCA48720.1 ribosome-recycling factor, putative [Plasmodium ovale]